MSTSHTKAPKKICQFETTWFLCDANPLLSSNALVFQLLQHQQPANFKFNPSENSYEITFLPHPSMSTQSQSPPTAQTATPPVQDALSSDSDQPLTEDYLLGMLDSILFQDYGSVNLINQHGHNLAHFCAQLRYHRVLTAAIEKGVDINAKDVNGWTPLDFARLHRDEDAIDILEGEWEDKVQDAIFTGLYTDLLRRLIPTLRSPMPSQPDLSNLSTSSNVVAQPANKATP